MSDQVSSSSTPPSPQPQQPAANTPVPSPAPAPPLPISPYTGLLYDPEWGTIIQKGAGQPIIQQLPSTEFERKSGQ